MAKNNKLLIEKIEDGIKFIQQQDKKLTPIIDYLTNNCLNGTENLSADKSFEYFGEINPDNINILYNLNTILYFVIP